MIDNWSVDLPPVATFAIDLGRHLAGAPSPIAIPHDGTALALSAWLASASVVLLYRTLRAAYRVGRRLLLPLTRLRLPSLPKAAERPWNLHHITPP